MLRTIAPAKINLYLHITGRRDDGYHFLDSLVAFTNIGDELSLEESEDFNIKICGPMAAALSGENLVEKAVKLLSNAVKTPLKVSIKLTKTLPIASGIGGGSSDAAAALRLLAEHWGINQDDPVLYQIAASLGQDIPCCIPRKTCYFRDIGNVTDAGPLLPHTNIVLVNPNKALPTPAVFKARQGNFDPAARLERVPKDAADLALLLSTRKNSLTDAACQLMPEISQMVFWLNSSQNCLLARMSGSGATCFGLYPDKSSALKAAEFIKASNPDWWVVPDFVPSTP